MRSNLFIISQHGWNYVISSAVFFVLFLLFDFDFLALLSFAAMAFFLFAFRNPERELFSFEEDSVLSPVDGIVSAITELDDSEYAYKIDIKSSYLDVSILRAPIDANVESLQFEHGTKVSTESKLFEDTSENVEIVFLNKNGIKIKVTHRVSQSFAPLSIDAIKSQRVMKSSRYGVMLCGITSIYLPRNVRLNVDLSNEVKASQTLLANLF
jgi:phosphatidylserine decarboxylase